MWAHADWSCWKIVTSSICTAWNIIWWFSQILSCSESLSFFFFLIFLPGGCISIWSLNFVMGFCKRTTSVWLSWVVIQLHRCVKSYPYRCFTPESGAFNAGMLDVPTDYGSMHFRLCCSLYVNGELRRTPKITSQALTRAVRAHHGQNKSHHAPTHTGMLAVHPKRVLARAVSEFASSSQGLRSAET